MRDVVGVGKEICLIRRPRYDGGVWDFIG